MKKELEEAKKNYLGYVETKYSPPANERDNKIIYKPTSDYTHRYFHYKPIPSAVDVKNRRGMFIIPLFFMMWFMANQEASEESKTRMSIAFVIVVMVMLLIHHLVPGSKIYLRLTIHGIWLRDEDHVIKWKHLVRSDIKEDNTDDESSTSYTLILHYFDERIDSFRSYEKPLGELMVSVEKISYLIEFFKKLYENSDYEKGE